MNLIRQTKHLAVFTLTLTNFVSAWAASSLEPTLLRTTTIAPGVELDIYVAGSSSDDRQTIWLYRPDPLPHNVPVVIVPPAGGTMVTAPPLTVGDRPEHIPYVKAGFVVISFTMTGIFEDGDGESEFIDAASKFRSGRAGVANTRSALDFALDRISVVDARRIYIAGHSSAATLALLFASTEPRIRGVVAFAPVWDVPTYLGPDLVQALDEISPGYRRFLEWSSPSSHLEKLLVPVLLFHARDDQIVPFEEAEKFAKLAQTSGTSVEFQTVESGGHYDSMIEKGIPLAIQWLNSLKQP